jgi:hypothetical protein
MEPEEIEETEYEKLYMTHPKAKTVEGFVIGLHILCKYMDDRLNQKFFLGAEHDIIYIYAEKPEEGSHDGLRLSELGFHYEEEC